MTRKKSATTTPESTISPLRQAIDRYLATTVPEYDWAAHWDRDEDAPDQLFRACIDTSPISEGALYYACGSVGVDPRPHAEIAAEYEKWGLTPRPTIPNTSTPQALYRLLYLIRPEKVDFSDMYKTTLFCFRSMDQRFLVEVDLFKYELGLYFYGPMEAIDRSGATGIFAGHPGSNNGFTCTDPDGVAFFNMVRVACEQKWLVYGGNDFEV